MEFRKIVFTTVMSVLTLLGVPAYAQDTDETEYQVSYEAMQTDYGYFGTTDAIFSNSETIICTFSLTQNKPNGNKIYPTMMNIWLHADAFATKSQELLIKQIAQAGTRTVDGQFRYPAILLLANNEEIELNFSINNLTEDYTHHTVMLTTPIYDPNNTHNSAMYGELATKLRRYDIVTITIANTTLNLQMLGFRSSEYINGICKELMSAGCTTASFSVPDSREAADFDVSGFQNMHRERSIDELVFHALGCFPPDIINIKPQTAVNIIKENTDWIIDDNPDFSELEFTHADGYDFTYHGIRIAAEMCWNMQEASPVLTGYNYYFYLNSKDKKTVKAEYLRLTDELRTLGFPMQPCKGDKGDKEPLSSQHPTLGYQLTTCYYLNINDQYVIQLKVTINNNQ